MLFSNHFVLTLSILIGMSATLFGQAATINKGSNHLRNACTPTLEWVGSLGGAHPSNYPYIAFDSDRNILVTGAFNSTIDLDIGAGVHNITSAGAQDFYIAKYDTNGALIWGFSMGGTDIDFTQAIAVDAAGNMYIGGRFRSQDVDFDHGPGTSVYSGDVQLDGFIAKYDGTNGAHMWSFPFAGATSQDVTSISITPAGDVLVGGFFYSTVDFDPGIGVANLSSAGNRDLFMAKYSSGGNFIWAKRMGGSSIDDVIHLRADAAENVYAVGRFYETADFDPGVGNHNLVAGSSGKSDMFIAKYDPLGNLIWAHGIGSTGVDYAHGIDFDRNGGFVVAGVFQGTVDFDPGAGSFNLTAPGSFDQIFVARYDANANFKFALQLGESNSDQAWDVVTDGGGNAFVTGTVNVATDLDPGAGTANVEEGYFVAKYDTGGTYLWSHSVNPGQIGTSGRSLSISTQGELAWAGEVDATTDFDIGPGVDSLVVSGGDDGFFAKFSCVAVPVSPQNCPPVVATCSDFNVTLNSNDQGSIVVNDIDAGSTNGICRSDAWLDITEFNCASAASTTVTLSVVGTGGDTATCTANVTFTAQKALQFASSFGSANAEQFADVETDAAGNIYVTGKTDGTTDFDPGAGTSNLSNSTIVAKYDANGSFVWAKGFAGTILHSQVVPDNSGNVFFAASYQGTVDFDPGPGTTNLSSSGTQDVGTVKLDANGNMVWAVTTHGLGGGSAGNIDLVDMDVDAADNVYLAMNYTGAWLFIPGDFSINSFRGGDSGDGAVCKYDPAGTPLLSRNLQGGGGTGEWIWDIEVDANNMFVAGHINWQTKMDWTTGSAASLISSVGNQEAGFVAKYDHAFNWISNIQVNTNTNESIRGISVNSSGDIYIGGYFSGNVLGLSTATQTGFVAEYTNNGSLNWAGKLAGARRVERLQVTANGILASGQFSGTMDADPGTGIANLLSLGAADIFVAEYTADGAFGSAFSFGSTGSDSLHYINWSENDDALYVAGQYSGDLVLSADNPEDTLSAFGSTDSYLAKFQACGIPDNCDPPIAICQNLTVTLNAIQQAAISPNDIDNGSSYACGLNKMEISPSNMSCAHLPSAQVTLFVIDLKNDTASCTSTVTVNDIGSLAINCPGDTTMENEEGLCGITYVYNAPVGTGNCSGVTTTRPTGLGSGALFPVGVTTETYRVTDGGGSTLECSFTVTVTDFQDPVAICPGDTAMNNDAGQCAATLNYTVQVADNCPGSTTSISSGLASGSAFPVGATVNSFLISDASGRTTSCSFSVTVSDTENPVAICQDITLNVTGEATNVSAIDINNNSTDNCAIGILSVSPASFDCNDEGPNAVVLTVSDNALNSGTCTATVQVVFSDSVQVSCPNDTIVFADINCEAVSTYGVLKTSGGCGGITSTQTAGLASGSTFPQGVTTNTFVVSDGSGGTDDCSFTVTVADNTAPNARCQDISISATGGSQISVDPLFINDGSTDNCGPLTYDLSTVTFNCNDIGFRNDVTLTVTDASFNTGTCGATVTVIARGLEVDGYVKHGNGLSGMDAGFLFKNDRFGMSLARLGDIDGNGFTDLVVGANRGDDNGTARDPGEVHILMLEAGYQVAKQQEISRTDGNFTGTINNDDWFGRAVADLGDLNGDGLLDIAVSAPYHDFIGNDNKGAVWILFLENDGTVKSHVKIEDGVGGLRLSNNDRFGMSLENAGDINGDGFDDLIVGSPLADAGGSKRGMARILFMTASGIPSGIVELTGNAFPLGANPLSNKDGFGRDIAGIGDMDGNGTPDLAISAAGDDNFGKSNSGAIYILFLNNTGAIIDYQKINGSEGDFTYFLDGQDGFGWSLGSGADFDNNGANDLIAGSPGSNDGRRDQGAIYLLLMNTDGTVNQNFKISELEGNFGGVLAKGDFFGSSADVIEGNLCEAVVAIGAYGSKSGRFDRVGASYVLQLGSGSAKNGNQFAVLDVDDELNPAFDGDSFKSMAQLYPNPNTGQFVVEIEHLKNQSYRLQVTDQFGRLLKNFVSERHEGAALKQVDLNQPAAGIYFVSLHIGSEVQTWKIIVTN